MAIKIAAETSSLLLCPMLGVIVSVLVEEGQEVQDGQALAPLLRHHKACPCDPSVATRGLQEQVLQ